jgi:hypothetical protein
MAWISQEKAGRTFDVLIQDEEADCGLCCVAMIVNLMGQGKPTSSMVRQNLQQGAYKASTKDKQGYVPTVLAKVRPEVATHSSGTYLQSLQPVLTRWKVGSLYNAGATNVQAAIQSAKAGEPIICHVTWTNGGGGHWVVITHSMVMSHYILDPFWGLQINSSLTRYVGLQRDPSSAGRVVPTDYGTWTGEWLKITGVV